MSFPFRGCLKKRTLLCALGATKLRPGQPLLFQHQFHIQHLPIAIKAQLPLVMLRKAFHPQTFLLFHPKCSSDPPSHPLNSPKNSASEGYRTAELSFGGVDTDELSSENIQAKRLPGLFFIGKVVDVSGHFSGFNFQWA